MEVNKDEAERCIQIAKNAIDSGDSEKAKKFLQKAERLFPTEEAKGNYHYFHVHYPRNIF